MKFGDKYELLESLTTGGVETFVANDRVRGERVLVHILHCDQQRPNQPTVQWVLETFRRVAPEPAGLVLETGRYSGTLYAYLVTKLPDEDALRGWVRQYKAQARDTQEFPGATPRLTPESQAPTADALPAEPSRAAGPIAQLFREFDLQAKSGPPSPPPKAIEQPSRPLPSIGLSADQAGVRPVPRWDLETPPVSVPQKPVPNASTPADAFRSDFTAKSFPPAPSAPPIKDNGPKPGEFTSFFQGPFRGDRPLETPAVSSSSQQMEPPRKTVGDFTAMFGPLKPVPEASVPASGIAGNEPAGTGFTGFFSPDMPSRTSSTTAPPSPGLPRVSVDPAPVFPAAPKEPVVAPQPASYVAPVPPIFPTPVPLNPPMPKSPAAPANLPSDNATRAFSSPTSEPAPGPPPPPSGPSAYTQIISVKPMNPAEDAAGSPKQGGPKSPALPGFPMPPMPAMAPPPLPPPFHMPPPPPVPKIAAPPPPPAPKLAKADIPAPPVSPWPLILTLTVLFVVAVLLVLYFVLKH
jgi:hypothetical protein